MLKLTDAQRKALQTIAENPGNIAANVRGVKGWKTVHATAEGALRRHGLIRSVPTGKTYMHRFATGYTETGEVHAWQLTETGKALVEG